MKKATIIFSFFLISVLSVGSYFLHRLYLQSYKREFKAQMFKANGNNSFSVIQINPVELYTNSARIIWEDENKEVVYNGILYDVVSITGNGLTVELKLVSDHEEMKLKADFAKMYDVNSRPTTKGPFELLKNFLALKYIAHLTGLELNTPVANCAIFCSPGEFAVITRIIPQDAPPPDLSV